MTDKTKHKKEWVVWNNIMRRCYRPENNNFRWYGAKGIKVCKRWHQFRNFFHDLGERPEGHRIGRTDHSKDYKPSNVQWEAVPKPKRKRGKMSPIKKWMKSTTPPWSTTALARFLGTTQGWMSSLITDNPATRRTPSRLLALDLYHLAGGDLSLQDILYTEGEVKDSLARIQTLGE